MIVSRRALAALLVLPALAPSARALEIVLDYTYDTGNFFGNATAKAALEAAASDLSHVLTNTLGAVSSDVYSGTNGSTTSTLDWSVSFTNPSTGGTITLNSFSFAANQYRVYVGARVLDGALLGQGGPAGVGVSFGGSGFASEWVGAAAAAEAASNAALLRGSGPTISRLTQTVTLGTSANFDLRVGLTVGNLWFDSDSAWHFDHTTAVDSGKSDLYSVALHELMHTLGVGGSYSWTSQVSGTTWLGAQGVAENGTGSGLIDSGGAHLASGTVSSTAIGGLNQEPVMSPTLTVGTRKYLTELDLAVMRDLGFETSAIPEPASAAALGALAALALGATRRRRRS